MFRKVTQMPFEKLFRRIQSRFYQHIVDAWYDGSMGIDASGIHHLETQSASGRAGHRYYEYFGTPTVGVTRALKRLGIDYNRFTFVDLGSGKGRVVLRAAKYPFQQTVGIELSPKLHEIARHNTDNAVRTGFVKSTVTLMNENVLDYEIPSSPLVIYIFSAFGPTVLDAVVDKIEASLRREPRPCYIIYVNPKHKECFDKSDMLDEIAPTGFERLMDRLVAPWPTATYRSRV